METWQIKVYTHTSIGLEVVMFHNLLSQTTQATAQNETNQTEMAQKSSAKASTVSFSPFE